MTKEVGLAGYTDRLSGRPGETIRFYVSSTATSSNVTARMTRSICADPNPKGPGLIEEDASAWFPSREFPGRHQPIESGSFAKSRGNLHVPPNSTTTLSVEIWVFPTVLLEDKHLQCIWSWGKLGLFLNSTGCLDVRYSQESILTSSKALLLHKWYRCVLTIVDSSKWELTILRQSGIAKKRASVFTASSCYSDAVGLCCTGSPFELATGGTFNGRLESPEIKIDGQTMASWDTSKNMTEWIIPSQIENDNPLILYNHPTRAVKGRLWDGTEFNWKHKPSHFGGIHFHDDDCYDFGWDCDLRWEIPINMPSGIYIVRLSNTIDQESLPLFICPAKCTSQGSSDKKKRICILVSTFTYVMYGNHARADFEPSWLERIKKWDAYPHNASQYTNYGPSTYNFHTDGSGICFASHLRPLFNLRPQYLTFGGSTCSGLRHFPADSHLIAWMHHEKIDYDIVTDHELHRDGVAAIASYQTLVTGSHPEYHSLETLNALQEFRDDFGGNLIYLGGNGFYWRVAAQDEDASLLEIRRSEDGVRTWASQPAEYHHMTDGGGYGGLWRRNHRPPQQLVGVGFTAQGSFVGMPYQRVCFDPRMDWVFEGIENEEVLGNFGFSGHGAAGFELDRVDRRLDGEEYDIVILAQSFDENKQYMLVPEEVLTTYSNLSGTTEDQARRSDMVFFQTSSGAKVFSVGSITFCGSLPWNNFDNNISVLLRNVILHFSE